MYTIYEHFNTNTIDCHVGKLLVCKNDPLVDSQTLKTLANCQSTIEIKFNFNEMGKTDEFKLSSNINFAYSAIGNNEDNDLRVFEVDNSAKSEQLVTKDYFVNALEFDEKSFKHFIHCNYLIFSSKKFKGIFNDNFDCSYYQLAKNKRSQIDYYLDDFQNKLRNYYIQQLNSCHLNNKW